MTNTVGSHRFLAVLAFLAMLLTLSPLPARGARANTPSAVVPAPAASPDAGGSIRINEVMPKPEQGAFEWVELWNAASIELDCLGCGLTDEDGNRYWLPSALPPVPAGAFVLIVFDGLGTSGDDYDFSDNVATLHSSAGLVGVFEDDADQVALVQRLRGGPPRMGVPVPGVPITPGGFRMVAFVAWGAPPGDDGAKAVAAGLWPEGGYVNLYRGLGLESPDLMLALGESIGLVAGGETAHPDHWAPYRVEEITPGAENSALAISWSQPPSGATLDSATFAVSWSAVPEATGYRFQMDAAADFSSPEVDLTLAEPVYLPASPVADGTYYWRVQVLYVAGQSAWSAAGQVTSLTLPEPLAGNGQGADLAYKTLGIDWQLQHKDTNMLCLDGDAETGNQSWDAPHTARGTHGNNYCARASVAMLASYYGGHLTQDRITYEIFRGSRPEGELGHNLPVSYAQADAVVNFALGTTVARQDGKPSFAQIKSWIDNDQPLGSTTPGHMRVIDGYFEFDLGPIHWQFLHILDPWDRDKWVSYDSDNIQSVWPCPSGTGGAPNVRSDEPGVSADSDGDGIVDFDEQNRFATDLATADSDADGVPDKADMREYVFDDAGHYGGGFGIFLRADADHDGLRKEVDPDNDNGGSLDGCEDTNQNGHYEPALGETSNFDLAQEKQCAGPYFRDDFDGIALDPNRWTSFLNGGTIVVEDGLVKVYRGYGEAFPYIYAALEPFPPGDFAVKIRVRYTSGGPRGTGVQLVRYLPVNSGLGCQFDPSLESGLPIAAIWQGDGVVEVAHLDRPLGCWMAPWPQRNPVPVGSAPQPESHAYEIRFVAGIISISVDGVDITSSTTVAERPHFLWFGNPATCWAGDWSGFEIDYIEVSAN